MQTGPRFLAHICPTKSTLPKRSAESDAGFDAAHPASLMNPIMFLRFQTQNTSIAVRQGQREGRALGHSQLELCSGTEDLLT